MENNNGRKKPDNPVREWISDNLRYIILIGGIALAAVIIFFLAQETMYDPQENTQSASAGLELEEDESEESSDTGETNYESEDSSAADVSDGSVTNSDTDVDALSEEIPKTQKAAVTNLVAAYFSALDSSNADEAALILESLSDEDRADISRGAYANGYSDITVYLYQGEEEDSYVAFARYEYSYPGYDTTLPALTRFYILTRDDGSLCIAASGTEESKSDYMNSIALRDDAAELIKEAQEAYDAALASDPALSEYIDSIS